MRGIIILALGLVFAITAYSQIFTNEDKQRAEKGDVSAQYFLYCAYSWGSGVEINHDEALRWLLKSAEGGFPKAEMVLGTIYARGQGLPKDKEKAFLWYKKAADKGLAEAQFLMGNCYMFGEGIEINEDEGSRYYKAAAKQQYQPAILSLEEIKKTPK